MHQGLGYWAVGGKEGWGRKQDFSENTTQKPYRESILELLRHFSLFPSTEEQVINLFFKSTQQHHTVWQKWDSRSEIQQEFSFQQDQVLILWTLWISWYFFIDWPMNKIRSSNWVQRGEGEEGTSDILLLLPAFQLHGDRCVLGSPWEQRRGTSTRCIKFVRTKGTWSNEKGVESCKRDMRNGQKTEIWLDEEYTGGQRWRMEQREKG